MDASHRYVDGHVLLRVGQDLTVNEARELQSNTKTVLIFDARDWWNRSTIKAEDGIGQLRLSPAPSVMLANRYPLLWDIGYETLVRVTPTLSVGNTLHAWVYGPAADWWARAASIELGYKPARIEDAIWEAGLKYDKILA